VICVKFRFFSARYGLLRVCKSSKHFLGRDGDLSYPPGCRHTESQKMENFTRILRLPEVIARTGLKKASIYARIKRGLFPAQRKIAGRAVGWFECEIEAFLQSIR